MRRIIIDTDPGIDDILALLLACASPELQIEAITTVNGNVDVEQTSYNALAFLEAVGRSDIPVARGSKFPLLQPLVDAGYYHGKNGVGEILLPAPQKALVAQNAADLIVQTVMESPGEITLVALGPLTNLALALKSKPEIVQAVREVVIMGGALRARGNITPASEFNIFVDPHAAHLVFHAGWPVRLVPLDVTNQVCLRREHLQAIRKSDTPTSRMIEAMVEYNLTKFATKDGSNGFAMHDPLCLATVVRPDFITWEEAYVAVELHGEHTLGETVAYFPEYGTAAPHAPNIQAAVGVDSEGFLQWYTERIYHYFKQGREQQ